MIGCLGLVIYGGGLLLAPKPAAPRRRVLRRRASLRSLFVRPHVAVMSIAALGARRGGRASLGPAAACRVAIGGRGPRDPRSSALVVLIGLASFAGTRMASGSATTDEERGTPVRRWRRRASRRRTGGSEFAPVAISTPGAAPAGVVSVLFRPFPWEARNVNALIAAAEGLLLLGLFAVSWRRRAQLSRSSRCVGRSWCSPAPTSSCSPIGFSFIANFGILARQRTQVLPMVLVLLALPLVRRPSSRRGRRVAGVDRTPGGPEEPVPTGGSTHAAERSGETAVASTRRRRCG